MEKPQLYRCRTAASVAFRGFVCAVESYDLFHDDLLAVVNIDALLCRLGDACAAHGVPVVVVRLALFGLYIADAGDGGRNVADDVLAVYGA